MSFFLILVCEAIGTAATPGLLCQPRVIVKTIVEKQMECRLQGKPTFSEKACPSLTFVHHKIPHDQTRVWTRAAAVGSRRLTAWAMARPSRRLTAWAIARPCYNVLLTNDPAIQCCIVWGAESVVKWVISKQIKDTKISLVHGIIWHDNCFELNWFQCFSFVPKFESICETYSILHEPIIRAVQILRIQFLCYLAKINNTDSITLLLLWY
jgi:hypothetical protein